MGTAADMQEVPSHQDGSCVCGDSLGTSKRTSGHRSFSEEGHTGSGGSLQCWLGSQAELEEGI